LKSYLVDDQLYLYGSLGFRMVEPKLTVNGANSREKK